MLIARYLNAVLRKHKFTHENSCYYLCNGYVYLDYSFQGVNSTSSGNATFIASASKNNRII